MARREYRSHVSEEVNADIRTTHGLESAEEIVWDGQAAPQQRITA